MALGFIAKGVGNDVGHTAHQFFISAGHTPSASCGCGGQCLNSFIDTGGYFVGGGRIVLGDITDDAARAYSSQLMTNLGEQDWEKLKQVDEALEKIKDGNYGICSTCDQPIPEARLDVVPFAKFCVECLANIENETQTPTNGLRKNDSEGNL